MARTAPHSIRLLTSACLAFVLGLAPAAADQSGAGASASSAGAVPVIAPDSTTFMLDNGMTVVVVPDHRAPVVTHVVYYKFGSADERPGQSGIAHFLEHLMFKGTPSHPGSKLTEAVEALGADENGVITNDYTVLPPDRGEREPPRRDGAGGRPHGQSQLPRGRRRGRAVGHPGGAEFPRRHGARRDPRRGAAGGPVPQQSAMAGRCWVGATRWKSSTAPSPTNTTIATTRPTTRSSSSPAT